MATRKGKIIPEPQPGTRTILTAPQAPAIKGEGDDSILCGNCGVTLVSNLANQSCGSPPARTFLPRKY